jgi:D-amino-acid dehydrogenase
VSEHTRAGFVQPGERWIDPSGLVDRLTDALRAMDVEVVEGARVTQVREDGGRVVVESSLGRFEGEAVVVTAGAWSRELCRALGTRLSMQPGKGYSFSVRPRSVPRRVLNFPDAHVIATPMGERLRFAGTMEFDGTYDRFDRRRIEAIVRGVSPYLRGIDWADRSEEWVGPRPMTPDGLPYIGLLPGRSRVFVAAGHNMLGVTLAPPTGKVVADLVLSGDPGIDLRPFSPERFARL